MAPARLHQTPQSSWCHVFFIFSLLAWLTSYCSDSKLLKPFNTNCNCSLYVSTFNSSVWQNVTVNQWATNFKHGVLLKYFPPHSAKLAHSSPIDKEPEPNSFSLSFDSLCKLVLWSYFWITFLCFLSFSVHVNYREERKCWFPGNTFIFQWSSQLHSLDLMTGTKWRYWKLNHWLAWTF